MMEMLTDPQVILSFLTLAALEIVLGIDNLLFVQIVASRCAPEKQKMARQIGLLLALGTRLLLLASIAWVAGLTAPIATLDWLGPDLAFELSWRDLILLGGGLFLLAKATTEIHHHIGGHEGGPKAGRYLTFGAAIFQIAMLDIVFSLDSVITAVGMADHISVMVAAVVAAMIVMIVAAQPVGEFVDNHPTVKVLCLAFLLLIGMALVGEGLHFHIPKGYLYFAIAFSALVEGINMWARARSARVKAARSQHP